MILNNNCNSKVVFASRSFQVRDTMASPSPSRPNNPNETGGWEPVVSRKTRQRQNRKEREREEERLSAARARKRRMAEIQEQARKDPLQHDRNKPFSKRTLRSCSKKTGYEIHEKPVVILNNKSTDGASKDCETNTSLSVCHVHVHEGKYELQEFVVENDQRVLVIK